jgi:preprotein translocase subunit SecA
MVLQVVDVRWREHLENMDYMREGIHLRSMAQKDPLVEYRNEGHVLFQELNRVIRMEVIGVLFHTRIEADESAGGHPAAPLPGASPNGNGSGGGLTYEHQTIAGSQAIAAAGGGDPMAGNGAPPRPVVKSEQESIGRNDPCWCGSGKKFKRCHGA